MYRDHSFYSCYSYSYFFTAAFVILMYASKLEVCPAVKENIRIFSLCRFQHKAKWHCLYFDIIGSQPAIDGVKHVGSVVTSGSHLSMMINH